MSDSLKAGLDHLGDVIEETVHDLKPKLRGWLHLSVTPLTLAAGIVLFVLSPTTTTKIGSAVFCGSALLLFAVSAIYHTGTWSPRVWAVLRRLDHANIFVLIAGLLHAVQPDPPRRRRAGGATDRGLERGDPRRALPGVLDRRSPLAVHADLHRARLGRDLLHPRVLRGRDRPRPRHRHRHLRADHQRWSALHLGGVVYGFKFPDPSPRWFGFHEVFHSFTILAFAAHYVAVSLATYSLR